jgi:hypothetical protein
MRTTQFQRFPRILRFLLLCGLIASTGLPARSQTKEATYENIDGLKILKPEDMQDYPSTPPPAGATILFDGKSTAGFETVDGKSPIPWTLTPAGAMRVTRGGIVSKALIAEPVHLHVEFRVPYMPKFKGQSRGNSGVYLQGRYEVQVLDSYGLESQDNDCGGIYKVAKPLVNACKAPTVWQAYDIDFWPPMFEDGKKVKAARITVKHNGQVIHDDVEIGVDNTVSGLGGDPSKPGPLHLQDHGDPVEFRNIWLVPLSKAKTAVTRPWIEIRGIYGGMPVLPKGKTLADFGVNAIWVGSGGVTSELVEELHAQGVKLFAEFNTMHESSFLKDHPDAAPVGTDGKISPPPDDWQGVCPTHPGYREYRMAEFRKTLEKAPIDGIWLDYHHSHASWEQAIPNMPETCFCSRCLSLFRKASGIDTGKSIAGILENHREAWVQWRCGVFTDWVRELDAIRDEVRPSALLGTFHCPWSLDDYDGAIRNTLAIDLKAQSEFIDVFSIMPYHARFGHAKDIGWVSKQTKWLGEHLGIRGEPGESKKIWPIVQLADWGETVSATEVPEILDYGTRKPASGVTIFHTTGLTSNPDRFEAMGQFYRSIAGK